MLNKNKKISLAIIGLGYVGLPLALEFGKKRSVIGFDINKDRINELIYGIDRNLEFDKKEIKKSKKLKLTNNLKELKSDNCYIITVPTPIDRLKKPNLKPLLLASKVVGNFIKKK